MTFLKSAAFKIGLVLTAAAALSACSSQDAPLMGYYLVYQDANGAAVTDASKAKDLPKSLAYYANNTGKGVFVETPAFVDESCLSSAAPATYDHLDKPALEYTFTPDCKASVKAFTGDHINRGFVIVLDGEIIAHARIAGAFDAVSMYVEGNFETAEDIEEMAARLLDK